MKMRSHKLQIVRTMMHNSEIEHQVNALVRIFEARNALRNLVEANLESPIIIENYTSLTELC